MKDIVLENYVNKLNKCDNFDEVVKAIHDSSRENKVPIIQDDGLDFLLFIVKELKPKRILELGTAVGFSSIMMAKSSNAIIDTIERNQEMYEMAVRNIKLLSLDDRIEVHFCDALELDLDELNKEYDLIFIDAGKAQNIKFFTKYSQLLSENGIILTYNILFHGYVEEYANNGKVNGSKDLNALVRKIHEYNNWLKALDDYDTTFLNIGDGIAVTRKRAK